MIACGPGALPPERAPHRCARLGGGGSPACSPDSSARRRRSSRSASVWPRGCAAWIRSGSLSASSAGPGCSGKGASALPDGSGTALRGLLGSRCSLALEHRRSPKGLDLLGASTIRFQGLCVSFLRLCQICDRRCRGWESTRCLSRRRRAECSELPTVPVEDGSRLTSVSERARSSRNESSRLNRSSHLHETSRTGVVSSVGQAPFSRRKTND